MPQHEPRHRPHGQRAFTLIELLVVMIVATLLLTFGVTGFASYSASQRASSTANRLLADLYLARSAASQRAGETAIVPGGADWDGGWRVVSDDGGLQVELGAAGIDAAEMLSVLDRDEGAPVDRLVFGRFGELEQPAGGAVFNLCLRGERRAVEVAGSGHASIRKLPTSESGCE